MGAQAKADEMIKDANAKAEEIINKAKLDADGIVVSRKASDGGEKTLGLTQNQLAAIDKLNKQLDDFNVAQATQILRWINSKNRYKKQLPVGSCFFIFRDKIRC